jgi:NAD(P)-dependent dehydrogenase (short-subunit alcohol dehydrogenase family)
MPGTDGRTIVITGVTRGLGRALVDRFIEAGHAVIGCGRSAESIGELQTLYQSPHRFDVLDVRDDAAVSQWAVSVLAENSPPDLLMNNAALINRNSPLWDVPCEEFSDVIDVNIKGVVNVIRHFVPAMVERQQGVIVNLSSGWGRSTSPEVAPYCATKWAMEGLTKALADELPSGMAAVPMNPGVIDTEMLRSCFGDSASHYGDAEDWSHRAAPFLLGLNERHNGQSVTAP